MSARFAYQCTVKMRSKPTRTLYESLESDLDELLNKQPPPSVEECARVMLKYMEKIKDAPAVLRRLADYIEARPEPVELSAKAIAGLLELNNLKGR